MVDLLIKIACFVKKEIMFAILKVAGLSYLVQGGQHLLKENTQCG